MNIHFLTEDFIRESFLLEISPIKTPHTGENILKVFSSVIQDFQISHSQIYMIMHDSASNMKSAFPEMKFYSSACANHLLQLAINDSLKSDEIILNLLERMKTICNHFHHSQKSDELLESIQEKLGLPKHELILYSEVRWDGKFLMIERCCEQKMAINAILHETSCTIKNINHED